MSSMALVGYAAKSSNELPEMLQNLCSRDVSVKEAAARKLQRFVSKGALKLSDEELKDFASRLNKEVNVLLSSKHKHENLGGVLAIRKLIEVKDSPLNTDVNLNLFGRYVHTVFPPMGSDMDVIKEATTALGEIAAHGMGGMTYKFVCTQVDKALEWLEHTTVRDEAKRHTATLIIYQMAMTQPAHIYQYIPRIFKFIFVVIRDPKLPVRLAGVKTLSRCFEIFTERPLFPSVFHSIEKGLRGKEDSIHGSILAAVEFVSKIDKEYIAQTNYFQSVCDELLRFKTHKSQLVCHTVIEAFPKIAKVMPEIFISYTSGSSAYYDVVINHLLKALKKDRDKPIAFSALGELAIAIGNNVAPYVKKIVTNISAALTIKKGRGSSEDVVLAAVGCVGQVATALGPAVDEELSSLLDQVFDAGLSTRMVESLGTVAIHIPALRKVIQRKMLDLLSMILQNVPYSHPGTPRDFLPLPPDAVQKPSSVTDGPMPQRRATKPDLLQLTPEAKAKLLLLALKSLRSFDFSGFILTKFARDCVMPYLNNDSKEFREEACLICAKLVVPEDLENPSVRACVDPVVVTEVLTALLRTAISDRKSRVRRTVLESFKPRLDEYLAKREILQLIFVCLYDEDVGSRRCAIALVGRLLDRNPAYILPALRELLVHLFNSLEYCDDLKNENMAADLVGHLIHHAPRVVRPYVDAVMDALLPKLELTISATTATHALSAIGELAEVAGTDMQSHVARLLPIILKTLDNNPVSSQGEVALRVLGQLVRSTGYVVAPYVEHSTLLGTLFTVLVEGKTPTFRREAMRVIGILGAMDPYREKDVTAAADSQKSKGDVDVAAGGDQQQQHPVGTEEFYQDLVIGELMSIAYRPKLEHIHPRVIRSCIIIVVKSGLKCVPYLKKIIPAFFHMIRTCDPLKRQALFKELGTIVKAVGPHIRSFIPDIFKVIVEYWLALGDNDRATSVGMHTAVINLIQASINALGRELDLSIPPLLRHCMNVFANDDTVERFPTLRVLEVLGLLGPCLEGWQTTVASAVVRVFADSIEMPMEVRKVAIQTLSRTARHLHFGILSSHLIHALCRVIVFEPDLRIDCVDCLYLIMYTIGDEFVAKGHIHTVSKVLEDVNLADITYQKIRECFLKGEELPECPAPSDIGMLRNNGPMNPLVEQPSQIINRSTQHELVVLCRHMTGDMQSWINRLNLVVLRESPSPSLAACQDLAATYEPFARRLFNAGFLSCWGELTPKNQLEVADGLERAMQSDQTFMQLMLNVAEFMSHHVNKIGLPIPNKLFGSMAVQCRAYAKALRYKEIEFQSFFDMAAIYNGLRPFNVDASPDLLAVVEDLIEVTQALHEPEAAQGVLAFARQQTDLTSDSTIQPSWYEKLDKWDKALEAYQEQLFDESATEDLDIRIRVMTCLERLGKWSDLYHEVTDCWTQVDNDHRLEVALLGCSAAAGLGEWEQLQIYVPALSDDNPDATFYKAVLAVAQHEFEQAETFIEKTRILLESPLASLWSESYTRGYGLMVKLQQLAELEEAIIYKKANNQSLRILICDTWEERLLGCRHSVDVWQRILQFRSLVLNPEDDLNLWLKFAALCRKNAGELGSNDATLDLCHSTLVRLLGCDPSQQPQYALPHDYPTVTYAYIKYMWVRAQQEDAPMSMKGECLNHLYHLIDYLGAGTQEGAGVEDQQLLARCYHKLGQWRAECQPELDDKLIRNVIEAFHFATLLDNSWYKAWHAWAFMSYEASEHFEKLGNTEESLSHAVMAVKGFFNSIALSSHSNIQDTLRLLTLWFRHGGEPELAQTIAAGVKTVAVDTWLQVIPQLIARITIVEPRVRDAVHDLLMMIGRNHPQALLFPLTVAAHSQHNSQVARRNVADFLLNKMREHSPLLVEQALMVSEELIRVAILWNEKWHEGLEEASKLYTDHDMEGMFAVLTPLHQDMNEIGADATEKEGEFVQMFSKDLREAWEWCRKYQRTGNQKDLVSAWDHYYHVYRKITKTLPQLTALELREVSPKLTAARSLSLVVPGTYRNLEEPVYIESFVPQLVVMNSKQRPRKLTVTGDDGKEYMYLLKAHEDLRQDERAMQLFGLVNVLLQNDASTLSRHLEIRTYFVLPLSPNLGLIEWVPTCDTFHSLIRDHRDRNRIILNIEVRLQLQITTEYDSLTVMQKVEVFRYTLANTTGDDLAKVMWLHSGDSETWLERRSNYTRSLAVMSMVGYLLGLGDRHPSNLMLDRKTGHVMHVDFGDCFEVAMERPKFPEKIPFRLTRMIVAAMEVSGIEGNFRSTCESVLALLRSNRDSVIAVLEAFVHDPLIDWGLSQKERSAESRQRSMSMSIEEGLSDDGRSVEAPNRRALDVLNRVQAKVDGRDFDPDVRLSVRDQVQRLIADATSHENLCQHYAGWCPFW